MIMVGCFGESVAWFCLGFMGIYDGGRKASKHHRTQTLGPETPKKCKPHPTDELQGKSADCSETTRLT